MNAVVTVNSAEAFVAACRAGLGIVQTPRMGMARDLESGEVVEILPKHRAAALPVFLLHPHGRTVPRRVRVVLDWLHSILRPHLRTRARAPSTADRGR